MGSGHSSDTVSIYVIDFLLRQHIIWPLDMMQAKKYLCKPISFVFIIFLFCHVFVIVSFFKVNCRLQRRLMNSRTTRGESNQLKVVTMLPKQHLVICVSFSFFFVFFEKWSVTTNRFTLQVKTCLFLFFFFYSFLRFCFFLLVTLPCPCEM